MPISSQDVRQLEKIIALAQELIAKADGGVKVSGKSAGKAVSASARRGKTGPANRRTGKELAAFRSMLKSQRKAGVPVAELARKHGVTASYIYQMD